MISSKQWSDVFNRIHSAFAELGKLSEYGDEQQTETWCYLTALVFRVLHENGLTMDILPAMPNAQDSIHSITQMEEWVCASLLAIQSKQHKLIEQMRMDIISQVQSYINDHMQDDTSLQSAADSVHMHPVYLSRIYKIQTGESLSNYILRVKMAKAAELLLDKNGLKIYTVSQQLGYSSSAYFGRVFKKFYQMTPQEYRAMHEQT